MRIAYIQPIGGASGDMMLGALTDLGMPLEHLESELAKLGVNGYRLEAHAQIRLTLRLPVGPHAICRQERLHQSPRLGKY